MIPAERTRNLMKLLGWQGGTIHAACKEIGVDHHEFLYADADFDDRGPCEAFRRGYSDAADIALYMHENRGNLQYWFGAIAAVNNDFQPVDEQGAA